ncbi:MAG: glycoside hydrolase family 13 protein [Sphaerochaetaceae bacterium]
MNDLQLEHKSCLPYQFITEDKWIYLMIKDYKKFEIKNLICCYSEPSEVINYENGEKKFYIKQEKIQRKVIGENVIYYYFKFRLISPKLRYYFTFSFDNKNYCLDERGVFENSDENLIRGFFINYCFFDKKYVIQSDHQNLLWYQIFPDRFSNSNYDKNDYPDLRQEKYRDYFFGGDFKGIINKIKYIKSLGFHGIYLNPIFQSNSVHRYDTINYYKIDKKLGNEEDFKHLCEACHSSGLKVMLDGVYNHCSNESEQFLDVLKNGKRSKYYNWFIIQDKDTYSLNLKYEKTKDHPYEVFGFLPIMPKWNTQNQEVQEFLISSAAEWTKKYNIDAWRLDVADEISDDFLRKYTLTLKNINPKIYIIGEIWSNPLHWLSGDIFNGVMNYTLYYIVRDFISEKIDNNQFCNRLIEYCSEIPLPIQAEMFNFCGNHDLPRIMYLCNNNKLKVLLALTITLILPGNYSCYYGNEIFLTGAADPCNRGVFPWGEEENRDKYQLIFCELLKYYNRHSRRNLMLENIEIKAEIMKLTTKDDEGSNELIVNLGEQEKSFHLKECITTGTFEKDEVILKKFEFALSRK